MIDFSSGEYGVKAVIRSEWQEEYLTKLIQNNVKELELNDGKGWHSKNVDFLEFLPNLTAMTLINFKIDCIQGVQYLKKLNYLNLLTYCRDAINFKCFPELIDCSFEWINGSESLFAVDSLKSLSVNNYKEVESNLFSNLINLEKLEIMNSNMECISAITPLTNLKSLHLANLNKLDAVSGIQELLNLEELEIQKCKNVSEVTEIFELKKLRRLLLLDMGKINTIIGIENLTELEYLFFYESTNIIDGDLSSIWKLNKLAKISFQNRRHYSHNREEFGHLYG